MDVLTPEQRHRNMSNIRSRNTKPELLLRKVLWERGLRYRLKNDLPGKPDIIFKKYRLAIFVDGCFWHGCPEHYIEPKTRTSFWKSKINGNIERDKKNNSYLADMGWTVLRFWEHEIKNNPHNAADKVQSAIYLRPL